jgi:MtN3 and saliva related transmembrane protein
MSVPFMSVPLAVATLAPIVNCVQLFPQLYKTFTTKRVDDLSFYSLVLLFTTNLLWMLHGYFIMDMSLIVAGLISMAVNLSLMVLYLMYRKKGL